MGMDNRRAHGYGNTSRANDMACPFLTQNLGSYLGQMTWPRAQNGQFFSVFGTASEGIFRGPGVGWWSGFGHIGDGNASLEPLPMAGDHKFGAFSPQNVGGTDVLYLPILPMNPTQLQPRHLDVCYLLPVLNSSL
ncbi:hypothetical protein K474DRAFT_277711 [Panus rudis PR-1116 ss-1]|nr:hypothetical protein K474DRAFT_277711 [Panus rudis PR-1116 ss-1]